MIWAWFELDFSLIRAWLEFDYHLPMCDLVLQCLKCIKSKSICKKEILLLKKCVNWKMFKKKNSFCAMKTTLVILMKRNRTNYRNENDLCSHSDYGQSMNHDQLYKAPACLYTYHHPTCTGNLSYLFYLVKNQVS